MLLRGIGGQFSRMRDIDNVFLSELPLTEDLRYLIMTDDLFLPRTILWKRNEGVVYVIN
jgi:hypothetical protein